VAIGDSHLVCDPTVPMSRRGGLRLPVGLYGYSFGGACAFGAATLTPNIRRLVLYEGWAPVKPALLALPAGVGE